MSSLIQQERERERESWCIMLMGMVLTRTHCYVAEFGLNLRPSTSYSPAAVHALPGSCPGAPPTGHRAQTPWRPFLPQPMHCEHPQTWRTKRHDMGMRVERGKEGEGVEHPIAGRRVWEWEKREIKWWAHSFKKKKKEEKTQRRWPYDLQETHPITKEKTDWVWNSTYMLLIWTNES